MEAADGAKKKRTFLARLVHRPVGLLGFIGSTLVLGNYIVSDRLREQAKDVASEAASARARFEMRLQLNLIVRQLEGLDVKARDLGARNALAKIQENQQPAWLDEMGTTFESMDVIRGQEVTTLAMIGEFDHEVAVRGKKDLDNYSEQEGQLSARVAVLANSRLPPDAEQLSAIRMALAVAAKTLHESVIVRVDDLDKKLSARKASADEDFASYTRWSIYVYVVGWLVALIGRILDAKGVGAEEG